MISVTNEHTEMSSIETDKIRRTVHKIPVESFEQRPGVVMRRPFPTWEQTSLDPFALLDDFSVHLPGGFPRHPHMGFEKVTYIVEGALQHEDSTGGTGVIRAGGVHRMTAGRHIYHSEMPVGREMTRGIQLWVNLPRRMKQAQPSSHAVQSDELPTVSFTGGQMKVIVGSGSPVSLHTSMVFYDVSFDDDAVAHVPIPNDYSTAFIYPIDGPGCRVQNERLQVGEMGELSAEGDLELCGETGFRALVIAGKPHHAPIHVFGPYVE
ncbi:pirin family protein [Alicyclobacillus dauci]|uniref:Pirin family protein n=1 Tax=Alicyclobacillus dauci TaxID=1475485 RepID=A0ABY6Z017_9BACL|nr:pirin family protein [Alicyclobacillus dauci]WAH36233.1 pirin family protein [Alicyclobacillus dauci]